MNDLEIKELYRENLRDFFDYVIHLFQIWESKPFRKVSGKVKDTWLYKAEVAIKDFNIALKEADKYWRFKEDQFLHEISSTEKKQLRKEELEEYRQELTAYVQKMATHSKQLISHLSIVRQNDLDSSRDPEIDEVLPTLRIISNVTFDDFLAMWKFKNKKS